MSESMKERIQRGKDAPNHLQKVVSLDYLSLRATLNPAQMPHDVPSLTYLCNDCLCATTKGSTKIEMAEIK